MYRQAATNVAGDAWPSPQEYQMPFISCPKDKITGWPNVITASAYIKGECPLPTHIIAKTYFSV